MVHLKQVHPKLEYAESIRNPYSKTQVQQVHHGESTEDRSPLDL